MAESGAAAPVVEPATAPHQKDPELELSYLLGMVGCLGGLALLAVVGAWLIQRYCWKTRRLKVLAFALCIASLCLIWYASSVSFVILNRFVLGGEVKGSRISFPATLTLAHMIVKGSLAALVFYRNHAAEIALFAAGNRGSPRRRWLNPLWSYRWAAGTYRLNRAVWCNFILPLGLATSLDIFLSNLSLRFVSMQLYTVCKSSALIWTFLLSLCLRLQKATLALSLAVAGVGSGVILTALQPTAVHAGGLIAVLAAAAFSASRWVFSEKFFERQGVQPSVFLIIALQAPVTVLLLLPLAAGEFSSLLEVVQTSSSAGTLLMGFGLGGGLLAFFLLVVELQLISMTSALTTNVLGHLKDLIAVGAAFIVLHEELTLLNAIGVGLTVVSAIAYSLVKARNNPSPSSPSGGVASSAGDGGKVNLAGMLSPGGNLADAIDSRNGGSSNSGGNSGGGGGGLSLARIEAYRLPFTGPGSSGLGLGIGGGGGGASGGGFEMIDLEDDDDDDGGDGDGNRNGGGRQQGAFDDDEEEDTGLVGAKTKGARANGTAIPMQSPQIGNHSSSSPAGRLEFSPDPDFSAASAAAGRKSSASKRPPPRLVVTGGGAQAVASGALRRLPFNGIVTTGTGIIDLDDLSSSSDDSNGTSTGAHLSSSADKLRGRISSRGGDGGGGGGPGGIIGRKNDRVSRAATTADDDDDAAGGGGRHDDREKTPLSLSMAPHSADRIKVSSNSQEEQDLSTGVRLGDWTVTAPGSISFARKKMGAGGASRAEKEASSDKA